MTPPTSEEILLEAWKRIAPQASTEAGFPRGCWPDIARAAVEIALAGSLQAELSFRPCQAIRRSLAQPKRIIDLSQLKL